MIFFALAMSIQRIAEFIFALHSHAVFVIFKAQLAHTGSSDALSVRAVGEGAVARGTDAAGIFA